MNFKKGPRHGRPRLRSERIPIPRLDWAQIMVDLHNAGCSANRVASHLGAAQCTAYNWVKGGEPKYGYGRALLRLHAQYCGASITILRQYSIVTPDGTCFSTTSALVPA